MTRREVRELCERKWRQSGVACAVAKTKWKIETGFLFAHRYGKYKSEVIDDMHLRSVRTRRNP